MESVTQNINYIWANLQDVYVRDQINWNVAIIVSLLALVVMLRPKIGEGMSHKRREYIRGWATDKFVHSVEEGVYADEITREDAKEIYRDLKKCFPVSDLFPNPELLKEAIQRRRASGVHSPVKLPGKEKPKWSKTVPAKA